jgi:hypothetical protein
VLLFVDQEVSTDRKVHTMDPIPSSSHSNDADVISLDDARSFFFVAQRTCAQQAQRLEKLCKQLDGLKAADEWLDVVVNELDASVNAAAEQHETFVTMSSRMHSYVDSIRQLANALAVKGRYMWDCSPVPDQLGRVNEQREEGTQIE